MNADMTRLRRRLVLLAGFGSAALLIGAYIFQSLGYAPCQMCLWQRYPHGAAIVLGVLFLFAPFLFVPLLGAVAALATSGIGVFHTGVERSWWDGPTSCSGGDIGDLSPEALLDQIMTAPLVRCDEVAWQLMGLSMASWNAVLSFGLALIWLLAYLLPSERLGQS